MRETGESSSVVRRSLHRHTGRANLRACGYAVPRPARADRRLCPRRHHRDLPLCGPPTRHRTTRIVRRVSHSNRRLASHPCTPIRAGRTKRDFTRSGGARRPPPARRSSTLHTARFGVDWMGSSSPPAAGRIRDRIGRSSIKTPGKSDPPDGFCHGLSDCSWLFRRPCAHYRVPTRWGRSSRSDRRWRPASCGVHTT